jgi:predicted AAA+ superfamily ATPase
MERSGSHLPQELGRELFSFKRIETFGSIKGQSETAIQLNFVVGCRGTGKTCLLKKLLKTMIMCSVPAPDLKKINYSICRLQSTFLLYFCRIKST